MAATLPLRTSSTSLEEACSLFKALADPGRLRVARLLLEGSFHGNELIEIVGAGQSTISRNLRILVEAGLLQGRREGRTIWYGWRAELTPAVAPLRAWVAEHVPELDPEARRRVHAVWEARRARTEQFFATVDPGDPAAAWLGSPDCLPHLLAYLPEGSTVLDVGTGTGRLLPELRERMDSVIGVDSSPGLLDEARRRLQSVGVTDVDLRLGDLAHLPVPDDAVDAVVANMVLHHVPEPARAIAELRRVLRPGGTLLIGDFLPHDQEWMRESLADQWLGFDPSDVQHWLGAAGFESVQVQPIPSTRPGSPGVFVARAVRAGDAP